jgi:N-acetylneuraminate synthase/pseudaminic acid synthase
MMKINIGERLVGEGCPTFIIAEMSANHGGSLEQALALVEAAKQSGADAVKLQTYRADTITLDSNKPDFQLPSSSPWANRANLYSLYKEAHTPWEWHKAIFDKIQSLGMEYFSAPFDHSAVEFLADLNVSAYKIASPEITDIPLIEKIAQQKKPVIISTGIANQKDIDLAIETLKSNGCKDIVILKCTTAYPAPIEECNLLTMQNYPQRYQCLNGLSDHTLGTLVATTAVALGASVIEKHFILDKSTASADAFFSLDQNEFTELVTLIRNTERILGKVDYNITTSANKNIGGRRSLYVSADIQKGEKLTAENIKSVRPSFGLHPKYYEDVLGTIATKDLSVGDRLTLDVISKK